MAVKDRPTLVAEYLDRPAVDIQRQARRPFTAIERGQMPDRQPQQAFMHYINVLVTAQIIQKPRQRGLRRPLLR